jgi:hypothetical protein
MTSLESSGANTAQNDYSDSYVQSRIARRLWNLVHIDLTIPAQRQVADEVRIELGVAPTVPLEHK